MPHRTELAGGRIQVLSGRAFRRVPQQQPDWCFAATEYMLRESYDVWNPALDALGLQRDQEGIAMFYYMTIENADYTADVAAMGEPLARERVRQRAVQNRGNVLLDGFDHAAISPAFPADASIFNAIDNDHLIALGDTHHWRLVYGYERASAQGRLTRLFYWDPLPPKGGNGAFEEDDIRNQRANRNVQALFLCPI